MNSYIENDYLVLELEDDKVVKYNIKDGYCIGKSGKKVKDLTTQLKGYDAYDIIQTIEDEVYRKFLTKVYYGSKGATSNFSTVLLKSRELEHLKPFIELGIEVDANLKYTINQIPEVLLNLAKANSNIRISNGRCRNYIEF